MNPIQLFALASRQAEWLSVRQEVVAGNIANASTPKYLAKDITPFSAVLDNTAMVQHMAVTQPGHMASNDISADNIDIYQMQTQTLLAGIADPDLKNKDLLEKFGAVLPGDIIRKLFLAGEIADLTAQITELNGYTTQEKADKAVKN